MVFKGGKKIALNTIGTTLTMQMLLVTNMVKEVVQFAQADKATAVLAPFLLTGWELLMRMQSECVLLERGSLEELLTIPEGRHSAVCIINRERKRLLTIRWSRRRHRPPGPLLRGPCTCTSTEQSPWCVVYRVESGVEALGIKPGNRLWEIRPGQVLEVGELRERRLYGTLMRQVQTLGNCCAQHLTMVTMNE